MIALGDERTFDQDPAFAIRMMVDIANKALSAAVNDPTTAVQVLDHIGEVLGHIGMTDLDARTKLAGADPPAGRDGDSPLGGLRDARTHRDPRVRCNLGADHATTPSTARGPSRDRTARAPTTGRRRAPPTRRHRRPRLARLRRPRPRERGRPPRDRWPRARLGAPSLGTAHSPGHDGRRRGTCGGVAGRRHCRRRSTVGWARSVTISTMPRDRKRLMALRATT